VVRPVERYGVAVEQGFHVVGLRGEPRRLAHLERALAGGDTRRALAGEHQQSPGPLDPCRVVDRRTHRVRDAREDLRRECLGAELEREPRCTSAAV
jgi:hypothetical protein